ncbi:hypothetical protein CDV31_017079 [Fusarium ambrosium]|uniref:Rhodopsin domain-containing protein n=1 Tax=Fusarium ambrosium TaxID=131363 RepID=A0A428RTQ4_9HYPO|nr:hypothetical protein CDV31_017079 [Fusarium ambrosium]
MSRVAGKGVPLFCLIIVLLVLSWPILIARMVVRRWIKSLGLDDWLMCVGVVLFTVICGLLLACCYHGSGQYAKALTPSDVMQGTKPITALWGETTTGSCNVQLNRRIGFYISVTAILTDWTLGVLPAILLWNIQMKFLIKLSVILVLSLGAV